MSKHTKGPWTYGKRRDGSIWLSIGDPSGPGSHMQGDFAGTEADAQITVSAPEMLAALHKVVAYARVACRAEGMPEGAEPKRLTAQIVGDSFALLDIKEIRELIARAEGRS